jgi:hypothetical protein
MPPVINPSRPQLSNLTQAEQVPVQKGRVHKLSSEVPFVSCESHCRNRLLRCAMGMPLGSEITQANPSPQGSPNTRKASSAIYEYKYSWYYSPLQVEACHTTYYFTFSTP